MTFLPTYRKPPVNEVVCGLLFHPLDKLFIPHVGLLWDKFRQNYPRIQTVQPIATSKGEIIVDSATNLPLPRLWFINQRDDQLVQFQFDRFYFNWRRREGVYPRYQHVFNQFENALNTFQGFLSEFNLGDLKIIEFELSYINHIPKGQGWNRLEEIDNIFLDFNWKKTPGRFLPNPVNIAWQADFPMPEEKGFLTVTLKKGVQTVDKTDLLVLELKARGPAKSNNREDLRDWFNSAHEMIVVGFSDLTSLDIQKVLWEKENA
jgi:uncharacterized protein (TIGR04255 family)